MKLQKRSLLSITTASFLAFSATSVYADTTYTVKSGDTLWQLANLNQTTVQTIQSMNHLHSDVIYVGQHLTLPKKQSSPSTRNYTIVYGDTLSGIAELFGTTVNQIKNLNHLQSDLIYAGQSLRIPSSLSRDESETGGIPDYLIPTYKDAGMKYGIPWTVLAAIHKIESNFSVENAPVSSAGAEGPMQFEPATFKQYGVAAPGHNDHPDINDVYDSIYSAANMLAMNGYRQDPYKAIYSYNHANWYVQKVLSYSNNLL
jgi:LysM repeat protein